MLTGMVKSVPLTCIAYETAALTRVKCFCPSFPALPGRSMSHNEKKEV